MPIDSNLRVVLETNGVVIGESEDVRICAAVLRLLSEEGKTKSDILDGLAAVDEYAVPETKKTTYQNNLASFAEEIGIKVNTLVGAIDPDTKAPFVRINKRNWEATMKPVPSRGPGAVAPLALVLTVLALWKEHADLGVTTTKDGLTVLQKLGLRDKNPSRSVANCHWLRARERGVVAINPAEISKAYEIVRALCEKRAPRLKDLG